MIALSIFLLFINCHTAYETPKEFTIPLIDALTPDLLPENPSNNQLFFATYNCGFQFSIDLFNNRTCAFPSLLPNTKLLLDNRADFNQASVRKFNAIIQAIDIAEKGNSIIIGLPNSESAGVVSTVGNIYDLATFSSLSPSSFLDDRNKYPYFTRMQIGTTREIEALLDTLNYFSDLSGPGWTDIGIIATVDSFGLDYTNELERQAPEKGINVVAFQQFLASAQSIDIELQELHDSGARVIFASIFGNIAEFLEQADSFGLIGDNYVWLFPANTAALLFTDATPLARGAITSRIYYDYGAYRDCFVDTLINADPRQYICSVNNPAVIDLIFAPFDAVLGTIYALDALDKMELLDKPIPAQTWAYALRNTSYDSITGHISFDSDGQRIATIEISFYHPEDQRFIVSQLHTPNEEIEILEPVIWFSNSTDIPDLDIREPFHYWSCEDGEEGYDATGKRITIQTPDGSDVDEIDSDYHCDFFVDCRNISDESRDCGSNYLALYIAFGIITVSLMLVVLALVIFVIVFGIVLNYQRVRIASPNFLIILLLSIFVGYSSIFTFYGKAHPVACGFRPWLLGLPAISMIGVLSVKNFRVYRIFKFPLKKTKFTDMEVFILWLCVMVPALFIVVLWMIISTPTATLKERDGKDHYVCATGGFTGEPGGIVFFSIFVAYSAFVLFVGAVISILARNIPSSFNETKLLTVSIYNLGFLAMVIIPVFLVVEPFNPFIAWILRTCAVLYAFTATLLVQFIPIIFGVVCVDRLRRLESAVIILTPTNSSGLSSEVRSSR